MQMAPLLLSSLLAAWSTEGGLAFTNTYSPDCFPQTTLCPSRLAAPLKGFYFEIILDLDEAVKQATQKYLIYPLANFS